LKGKKVLILNHQGSLKKIIKVKTKASEELKDIFRGGDEQAITKIGYTLTPTQ